MNLLKCGTKASPNNRPDIQATITGINIRFQRIIYELSYFWDGEYKQVWLDECEFITEETSKVKIGYKN